MKASDFFLDADDAASALEIALIAEREEAQARLTAIAVMLAKLDAGTIPYKDMRRRATQ